MSHFYTIVLIPKDIQDQNAALEKLLAPFSEHIDVEPYDTDCYCIGRDAVNETELAMSPTIDEMRKQFREILDKKRNDRQDKIPTINEELEQIDADWKEFIAPWRAEIDEKTKAHPLYKKPGPECTECKGTGKYETTYNPNSKWDWWVIGGRWNGSITKNRPGSERFRQVGIEDLICVSHNIDSENCVPTPELLEYWNPKINTPFALLTPDNVWHEKGEMLMFGQSNDKSSIQEWRNDVMALLKANQDTIAIGCDMHI